METNKPLAGFRILNTRSRTQASELTKLLTHLGADVKEIPTIEIIYVDEKSSLAQEIQRVNRYDWIVFTSSNAVKIFFTLLKTFGLNTNTLKGCKIASIGKGTAKAVTSYSITVDVLSKRAVAESLVECLKENGPWTGKKVLLPSAKKTRNVLPHSLKQWGADVTTVTAYTTVIPQRVDKKLLQLILEKKYDIITFTSSSTCLNLLKILGEDRFNSIRLHMKAASIGPITTATMKNLGLNPVVEAKESTLPALVEGLTEYLTASCYAHKNNNPP